MADEGAAGAAGKSLPKVFAYREMVAPGTLGLCVGVCCALVTLFTLLGPLDTDLTLGWIERATLWSLAGMLDFAISYAACILTLYLVRSRPLVHVRLALAAMSVILAAPCMAITYTAYGLFHGGTSPDVGMGSLYFFNLVFVLFIVALLDHVLQLRLRLKRLTAGAEYEHTGDIQGSKASTIYGDDLQQEEAAVERQSSELQENSIFDRLPDALGSDVIYLKVSGHYVQVTTTSGSGLILMRFSDAVAALGDLGMRVHRSYWVAYRHVTHLIRRNRHRRTYLRVTGEHELPVSRSFLPAVYRAVSSADGPAHEKAIVLRRHDT